MLCRRSRGRKDGRLFAVLEIPDEVFDMPDARPSGRGDCGLVAAGVSRGGAGSRPAWSAFAARRLLAIDLRRRRCLDAYYAAFRWPDAIYNLLIVGALSAAFIPVFLEAEGEEGEEDAGRFATQAFAWTAATVALACAALCRRALARAGDRFWISAGTAAARRRAYAHHVVLAVLPGALAVFGARFQPSGASRVFRCACPL